MDGIKLLLLLVASAQVETGNERDYGWQVNKDGVLEYIIQISPEKKRAMETPPSAVYPKGIENASSMPSELVGRAERVVVRFGTEILPREPSLQELDRMPRLYAQPNVNAAAVLGDDNFRNLEAPVRNIQGQGTPPLLPALPNGLPGAANQVGSLLNQAGEAANALRGDLSERLSDALPTIGSANSTMPGRNLPEPSTVAQNFPNQSGGTAGFADETRGGLSSKFSNTAAPATQPNPATIPQANTPTRPEYQPPSNSSSPFASSNPASANTTNRNSTLGSALGTNNPTTPLYPADRNPPSLSNQPTIPQQRTPSPSFGTSPGLTSSTNDWVTNTNAPNYPPAMSQANDRYNYGTPSNLPPGYTSAPNPNTYQNPTHIASNTGALTPASNTPPFVQQNNTIPNVNQIGVGNQNGGVGQASTPRLTTKQLEDALAVQSKLDKNKDGTLTADEYNSASVDGIVLTLFVVSLLVNLYLGHLIRKLLMRYRLVLTNVRNQAAYT